MGNPNPNEGTRFKRGVSGNVGGRPAIAREWKEAAKSSLKDFKQLLNHFLQLSDTEQQKVIDDPDQPSINKCLARALLICSRDGDLYRLNFLLDRLYGKAKEEIEVTDKRPQMLIRRDGAEILFVNKPEKKEGENAG